MPNRDRVSYGRAARAALCLLSMALGARSNIGQWHTGCTP